MSKLRTLTALAVAILATLALTATTVSAAVVDQNDDPYTGPITGVQTAGVMSGSLNWAVQADVTGTITDAGFPATGSIGFDFHSCSLPGFGCDQTADGPWEFEIDQNGILTIDEPLTFTVSFGAGSVVCDLVALDGIEGQVTGGDPAMIEFVDQYFQSPICGTHVWNASIEIGQPNGGLWIQ